MSIAPDLLNVAIEIPLHFEGRIAAELLLSQAGEHDGDHSFSCNARSRHHADIAALVAGAGGLARIEADGFEWPPQRRNGLQISAHHNVLAVRDAAFDSPRVVLLANETCRLAGIVFGIVDGVVDRGAKRFRSRDAAPDLDRLHRLQAHHRPGEQTVEALIPVCIRSQAGGNLMRDHLKDSANGIAGARDLFYLLFHARLNFSVYATEDDLIPGGGSGNLIPRSGAAELDSAHADDMAGNLNSQMQQQQLGEGSSGHAGSRFPSRGAFEHVPGVGKVVFECSGKIRMAGPRRFNGLVFGWIAGLDGQFLFPVLPVAVHDLDGDGRADRFAVAHAGKNVRLVGLDLHSPAAAVALLPPPQLPVDEVEIDRHAGGKP